MTRYLYLVALVGSWVGVLLVDRRLALGVAGRRLIRCVLVTVPAFLTFDALGAARGWFHSYPARNSLILPPGIPIEEPILLSFLCAVSVMLWRGSTWLRASRRRAAEGRDGRRSDGGSDLRPERLP